MSGADSKITAPPLISSPLTSASDEEEKRRQAVLLWGTERTQSAIDNLVRALGDYSWRVRKTALDAVILHHPHPGLIPTLVRALASQDNAGLRNASAEALTRIGEESVPDLARAVGASDPDLQKFAIDVLGEIGAPSSVPCLVSALEDPDENVRAAAAEALGKIGSIEAIDALWRKALSSNDLLMKLSSLEALAKLEAPGAFEHLATLSKNRFVAKPAYALLAVCPDPRAIELLVSGIAESARSQRASALFGLIKRLEQSMDGELDLIRAAVVEKRASLVTVLSEMVRTDDIQLQRAAMRILGFLQEPSIAKTILEALKSDEALDAAELALSDLGPEAIPVIAESLPSIGDTARELAASILATRGDSRAVRLLVDALLGSERRTREIAATVLGRLATEEVLPDLLESLSKADHELRDMIEDVLEQAFERISASGREMLMTRLNDTSHAADSFWRLFAKIVQAVDVPLLTGALKHENESVRAAAAEGLSRLKTQDARGALLLCLSDEAATVRQIACAKLAEFNDERVRDALILATQDEDVAVATTAATSLRKFHSPAVKETLLRLIDAERPQIVLASIVSLAAVDQQAAASVLPKMLKHSDAEVVKETIREILPLVPSEVPKFAEAILSHPLWDVRYVSAQTLAKIGGVKGLLESRLQVETDALVRESLEGAIHGGRATET